MSSATITQKESRLQRIVNILLLNASFIDNLGLLKGKMGIALFFFHYARYTGNKTYEEYAGELVDEIYEEINLATPADFSSGLTGIGWGIEYLVKNGFVEADTDEALEDTDNRIYQQMLNSPILIGNEEDIFGYGLYYLARLKHRNDDENITILNIKAILIHLVDECERIFVHKRFLDYNITCIGIKPLISVLYFLSEIHQLEIYPHKVQKCLQYIPPFIEHAVHNGADVYDKTVLLGILDSMIKQTTVEISNILKASKEVVRKSMHNTNEEGLINNPIITQKWYYTVLPASITGLSNIVPDEIIGNEEDWNRQLDKLSKEDPGLKGLTGIAWWLLSKETSHVNIEVKEKAL